MKYSGLFKTLFFAALAITVYSFGVENGKDLMSGQQESTIDVEQAKTFFTSYYNQAQPYSGIPKGVTIDINQYNAMKTAVESNADLSGFVIYYGINNQQNYVSMVVPLNESGSEMTGSIYSTERDIMGFCPMACDRTSAIGGTD